jgi:hypothetical protein
MSRRRPPAPAADALDADLARWRADPCAFIRDVLIDPETEAPFTLYPAQERFLRAALTGCRKDYRGEVH